MVTRLHWCMGNFFIVPHDQAIDDGDQNSTDFVEEEAILCFLIL